MNVNVRFIIRVKLGWDRYEREKKKSCGHQSYERVKGRKQLI